MFCHVFTPNSERRGIYQLGYGVPAKLDGTPDFKNYEYEWFECKDRDGVEVKYRSKPNDR